MTYEDTDTLIIGGGVIGLSIAWHLSRENQAVTMIDSAEPGQSSRAAAGMLAPLAEARGPGPFLDLALESLRRYPDFVEALNEESGLDLEICGPGMLRVARTAEEESALGEAFEWQAKLGLPLCRLTGEEVRRLEPDTAARVRAALLSPAERHIEPRLLLAGLTSACRNRGVRFVSGSVTDMEMTSERVIAAQTNSDRFPCQTLVIAGGAWSKFWGQILGVSVPIQPLRGQILALGPCQPILLRHTLYTHGAYLVPRSDGRIVAGATEESVGFETQTTAYGMASLRANAEELIPALSNWPLQSAWTGLRPLSVDGLPLLGRVPRWGNIHIAAGHGRNGILLAPVTAALMADSILHDAKLPEAFDPARFGGRL